MAATNSRSAPSVDECESIVNDFLHCLVSYKNDREKCNNIELVIDQCQGRIQAMTGAPPEASYCTDEMSDYSKCAIRLNTSLCANEYKKLHECKIHRRRFLFGEDFGLISMNPQSRKKW